MSPPSDIDIRIAAADDMEDILYGFRTYYWPHEPLSTGYKIKTASPLEEAFFMSIPQKGFSLLATDPDRGDKVAGFLTIDIYTPKSVEEFEEFMKSHPPPDERLEALKGIFLKLESKANLFELYKVNKVFLLAAVAVDPLMRGKSIGKKLYEKAFTMAESHGCKVIATDCTSCYSSQIAERLGMECINEVAYKDHVDENGERIFKPASIHTHMRRFVKVL